MPKPDSCAPPPKDWYERKTLSETVIGYVRKSATRLRVCFKDAYEVAFSTYGRDVITFPGRCEDECLTSAVRMCGSDEKSVYESRQFCKFACYFPDVSDSSDCLAKCHRACVQGLYAESGLRKILFEARSVHGEDPIKARACMDMCAEGCLIRLTKRKSPKSKAKSLEATRV